MNDMNAHAEANIAKLVIFGGALLALIGMVRWGTLAHIAALGFFSCAIGLVLLRKHARMGGTATTAKQLFIVAIASFAAGVAVLVARIAGF